MINIKLNPELNDFTIKSFQSIGVICEIKSKNDCKSLTNWIKQLKHLGFKTIKIFTLVNDKNTFSILKSALYFNTISKNNCIFKKPFSKKYYNFIEAKFDILVDLTQETKPVVKYILDHSKTNYKIGINKLNANQTYTKSIICVNTNIEFVLQKTKSFFVNQKLPKNNLRIKRYLDKF